MKWHKSWAYLPPTLRYYGKEGLLPFVERSSGGIRMFRENDFEWLQVIRCMKKAGMSIKDKRYAVIIVDDVEYRLAHPEEWTDFELFCQEENRRLNPQMYQ